MLLYQDLKWILGILDEKKSMISGLNSKNYETIAKAILEEEFIRSVSLKNKTSEWSKDHNALKEELDVFEK